MPARTPETDLPDQVRHRVLGLAGYSRGRLNRRLVVLERDRDTYVEAVSYCLPLIALIKHGSFEQENEWRLVVPRYDLDYTGMKVRTAGGQLVPYVECSFERTAIAEIVIGPGGDLHSERAVRALLFANGYDPDTIQVSYSAAPFRG